MANLKLKKLDITEHYVKENFHNKCIYCGKLLKSSLPYNLKRHIIINHKNVAKKIGLMENNSKYMDTQEITISFSKNQFFKGCIQLLTENFLPFEIFNADGFKNVCECFMKPLNLHVNAENMHSKLDLVSLNIKNSIIHELKNKLFCLKIDIATRFNRSLLGINAQFIKNGNIKIRTLSMTEIYASDSENVSCMVLETLKQYDVDLSQIISVTCDNGANMIKATKLLEESLTEEQLDKVIENLDKNQLDDVLNDKTLYSDGFSIVCVRCAVHTMQLAINDLLKKSNIKEKIDFFRNIAKKMRTASNRLQLTTAKLKIPKIDVVTRWGSTFEMLEILVNQSDIITNLLKPHPHDYEKFKNSIGLLKNLASTLEILYKSTKLLQEENLTMCEFFKIWLNTECELENNNNDMAKCILKNLNQRKENLKENSALWGALYLDPSINFKNSPFFTSETKTIAKDFLIAIYRRLTTLKHSDSVPSTSSLPQQITSSSSQISPNTSNDELQFTPGSSKSTVNFAAIESKMALTDNCCREENLSINAELEKLENRQSRMSMTQNALEYWNNQKENELFGLAQTVLAVPATQVSVERAFSSLALVLSQKRTKLSADNLQKLLIVKLNQELLEDIELK